MFVKGTVVGFSLNSVILSYFVNSRLLQSTLSNNEVDSSRIPVKQKVKLGDELILDAHYEGGIKHRSLLPTFENQIEFLQLQRLDCVEAVVRYSSAAGSVIEVSSNLFGFVYNINTLPIGQKILFGITKIDPLTERLVGVLDHVFSREPLKVNFPFTYRPEIVFAFSQQLKIAA